jgi:hypothetical protein
MPSICALCSRDAGASKLFVSVDPDRRAEPRLPICSACYVVAVRHGYHVVYRIAA